MKLHLPKSLLVAVLACYGIIFSSVQASVSVETDESGYKTYTWSGSDTGNQSMNYSSYTENDTIVFKLENDGTNNYFTNANNNATHVTNANVQIIDDTTTTAVTGLILTNGWTNNHQVFTGTLTGNGVIQKVNNGTDTKLTFEGDATGYTGKMLLYTGSGGPRFTLTFGGRGSAIAAAATTESKGVAGTGDVEYANAANTLQFNYTSAENPVYITNLIKDTNTSDKQNSILNLKGGADYILTKTVTVDEININDGEVTFLDEVNVINLHANGKINIQEDATLNITGELNIAEGLSNKGRITFAENTTLNYTSVSLDSTGFIDSNVTLVSGGTVEGHENLTILYAGSQINATIAWQNNQLVASSSFYNIAQGDTASLSKIQTETENKINEIYVQGILENVSDTAIESSPNLISGNGRVKVDAKLETQLSKLNNFSGTIELIEGGKIHFGNNPNLLPNVQTIQINSGAYITGGGDGSTFSHNLLLNEGCIMVNGGTWNGDIHIKNDSSIELWNSATLSGTITTESGKTLSVTNVTVMDGTPTGGTLTLNGTVGKLDGGILDIKYGTVKIDGHTGGNALIAGAIKVGASATLQVESGDTLGYRTNGGNYTDSITAKGSSKSALAKVIFTNTQTLNTDLILEGYAEVSGAGFNTFGGKVTASGVANEIKNAIQQREEITFDIQPSGELLVSGTWTDYREGAGSVIKEGTGTMTVSGNITTQHVFEVKEGLLNIGGTQNSIKELNVSCDNATTANVTIKEDAKLTLSTLKLNNTEGKTAEVSLEENAVINVGVVSIKGLSSEETKTASIRNIGDENSTGEAYATNNTGYAIKNAAVSINSAEAVTFSNKLDNSSISNNGTGTVNLVYGNSDRTEVHAINGSINMMWMDGTDNPSLDALNKLTVNDNLTVATQKQGEASLDAIKNYSSLSVSEATKLGKNAVLMANLEIVSGSLTLNGYGESAASILGTLTLNTGLELAGDVLTQIQALQKGDSMAIFNQVSDLVLNGTTEANVMTLSESALTEVDASLYFTNLEEGNYLLVYNGAEQIVSIQATIPEPTTATLSLLALAALAARRRRASR